MESADLTIEETVALLREHAHTYEGDHPDAGRTLIHSRLGGIGADWDLESAIALAEASTWRGWVSSLLGHNLGIGTERDGRARLYCFDVPAPKSVEV